MSFRRREKRVCCFGRNKNKHKKLKIVHLHADSELTQHSTQLLTRDFLGRVSPALQLSVSIRLTVWEYNTPCVMIYRFLLALAANKSYAFLLWVVRVWPTANNILCSARRLAPNATLGASSLWFSPPALYAPAALLLLRTCLLTTGMSFFPKGRRHQANVNWLPNAWGWIKPGR